MQTKPTDHVADEHPIDRVARLAGGRRILSEKLGVSTAAIGNWKVRGVPFGQCPAIERLVGGAVTRKDLRPDDYADMWPELAQPSAPRSFAATDAVAQGVANV